MRSNTRITLGVLVAALVLAVPALASAAPSAPKPLEAYATASCYTDPNTGAVSQEVAWTYVNLYFADFNVSWSSDPGIIPIGTQIVPNAHAWDQLFPADKVGWVWVILSGRYVDGSGPQLVPNVVFLRGCAH